MANGTIRDDKVKELEQSIDDSFLEKSMNYSLADAIREGSTVTRQCVGNWSDENGDTACAMQAALIAVKARHLTD